MIRDVLSSPLLSTFFYTSIPPVLPIPLSFIQCSTLFTYMFLFLFFYSLFLILYSFLQVAQADHISQTNSLQNHVKSLEVRTVLTHTHKYVIVLLSVHDKVYDLYLFVRRNKIICPLFSFSFHPVLFSICYILSIHIVPFPLSLLLTHSYPWSSLSYHYLLFFECRLKYSDRETRALL